MRPFFSTLMDKVTLREPRYLCLAPSPPESCSPLRCCLRFLLVWHAFNISIKPLLILTISLDHWITSFAGLRAVFEHLNAQIISPSEMKCLPWHRLGQKRHEIIHSSRYNRYILLSCTCSRKFQNFLKLEKLRSISDLMYTISGRFVF